MSLLGLFLDLRRTSSYVLRSQFILFSIFFYLIKINLDADVAFFNAKIDFLIIILMCHQPR